jgi:exo-beta-1,3-glucanase (GH17 family)
MSIVHPWFADTAILDAATWTFTFFKETSVDVANTLANKPQMYIGETGWPVDSLAGAVSEASVPNLQIFINNFVCTANRQGVKYFFFEFDDIQWNLYSAGVEDFLWGLFHPNKTLKAIKLPDCFHD